MSLDFRICLPDTSLHLRFCYHSQSPYFFKIVNVIHEYGEWNMTSGKLISSIAIREDRRKIFQINSKLCLKLLSTALTVQSESYVFDN